MSILLQDLRYALRLLRKQPGFTFITLLTLSLGIGANSAIFSIINTVLLKPFPYRDADRLYVVAQVNREQTVGVMRTTALDFLDWQKQNTAFDGLAGGVGTGFTFTGESEPETVAGQMVSANLFDVLGVRPLLGRTLRADENEAGHDRVLVLSHALWQRRFAGDRQVVNRTVTINGTPYTIVGVMPPGFQYPEERFQAWAPLRFYGTLEADAVPVNRQAHYLRVVGRLKAGVTEDQAQQEMTRVNAALGRQFPNTSNGIDRMSIVSLSEQLLGPVRPALLLLLAAVWFVLLIACANVTHLLLAQFTARQPELAVRLALGAGRGRIIRQVLTENLLLSALGGACGLLLASWIVQMVMLLGPRDLPRLQDVTLDARVMLFTLAIACVSALFSGMLPVLQLARADVSERALVPGRGNTGGRANTVVRASLIVAEVALSLMLVIGAGVMIRSFLRLQHVDKGFDTTHRLTFGVVLQAARYPEASHMRAFADQLIERLRHEPGVEVVGVTSLLPLGGNEMSDGYFIDGYASPHPGDPIIAAFRGVTPDYFNAMGIRVLQGRAFTDADRDRAPRVAIVNDSFARTYLRDRDPNRGNRESRESRENREDGENRENRGAAIGRRFNGGRDTPWITIVGVVADVKHRSLEEQARPEVFFPHAQMSAGLLSRWLRSYSFVIRTAVEPETIENAIRADVRQLDPQLPVQDLKTMDAMVADSIAAPRFRTLLVGAFGAIAIVLAAVGIFGVISYLVSQRTREIGIRIALGAQPHDVRRVVMGRALTLTLVGVLAGLAGAWALRTWLARLLFEISPTDPLTVASAAALVLGMAWLASYLPARRATHIDPMVACRTD
jgi:putative ABC transport system permease protein